MERLWYIYTHGDVRLIGELMDRFETTGSVTVPKELLEKVEIIIDFSIFEIVYVSIDIDHSYNLTGVVCMWT